MFVLVTCCTGRGALHRYRRGQGFKIRTGLIFFSGLISTTSSIVFIAARIFYVRFFTAVHIHDFHISIIMSVIALFSSFFMTLTNQGLVGYHRFTMKCKETH